ncbi:VOC family protein [Caulobacter soli]|uniref:VOC family protein n=1 Tax=Caulobacter soli TaxID=2708539 RepID=UPI0013EC8DAC|nr:VOC family protein [Caulobacter soli]
MGAKRQALTERHPAPLSPAKLAHLVLVTSQFEAAKAWYATVLNAHPAYENAQVCFMTYDDEHHRIGIINMPGLATPPPGVAGLDHMAFTFDDLGQLLATFQRLKAEGITPYWTINHGPTISFYYRDVDGNKVELQYDIFRTVADIDAFFASGAYDENFMGIIIDPEDLASRYEAGESMDDLTRRPTLPAGKTPWDMHRP